VAGEDDRLEMEMVMREHGSSWVVPTAVHPSNSRGSTTPAAGGSGRFRLVKMEEQGQRMQNHPRPNQPTLNFSWEMEITVVEVSTRDKDSTREDLTKDSTKVDKGSTKEASTKEGSTKEASTKVDKVLTKEDSTKDSTKVDKVSTKEDSTREAGVHANVQD